jgi:1-acyl-sn-glycerol-3-phosphate acyltransferase
LLRDNTALFLLSDLWYRACHALCAGFTTTLFGLRFERQHPFPEKGPVLVVANHQSYLDPPLVGLSSGRRLVYLARKSLFRSPVFSGLIRSLNAVPIDQDGVGKEGIKTILGELGKGKAVLVFPEGSRTPDGKIHPFKPGIHLLIKRSRALVVPAGIAGAYQAWPIWRKYPVFSPVFLPPGASSIGVVLGKPFPSEELADMPREAALERLRGEIACLKQRAEEIRLGSPLRAARPER